MKIAVTGASGFIGGHLCEALRIDGHDVLELVRQTPQEPHEVQWDPRGEVDTARLEGVDAVVHLAAENIAGKRWTDAQKERIIESRRQGTHTLAAALGGLDKKPEVLVCASGIDAYGDAGDTIISDDPDQRPDYGDGFLPEVVKVWEESAGPAREAGIRVVHARFGMVLDKDEGAMEKMLPPFKMGVGGRLGDGRQWMSWVHIDDLVAAVRFALEEESLEGPVHVTAPEPVRNATFTEELGRVLHRPTLFIVPGFALKLLYGQMGEEFLLWSKRAHPDRLQAAGFRFAHPRLPEALDDLFLDD